MAVILSHMSGNATRVPCALEPAAGRAMTSVMIPLTIEIAGRCAAAVAALGWGISVVGLVAPSATAFELLNGMGADDLAYHPMLDYWLRMTAFAFTVIGLQFLALVVWWRRLTALAWAGSVFQLLGGAVLAISAAAIRLNSGNFHADIAFCFSTGAIMLASLIAGHWRRTRDQASGRP